MSLVSDLREARALIDTPAKWCQGAARRFDNTGHLCQRCAQGALDAATPGDDDRYVAGLFALREAIGCECGVPTWNDMPGRTHAEVIAAFDRAIVDAEMFA